MTLTMPKNYDNDDDDEQVRSQVDSGNSRLLGDYKGRFIEPEEVSTNSDNKKALAAAAKSQKLKDRLIPGVSMKNPIQAKKQRPKIGKISESPKLDCAPQSMLPPWI